MKKILACLVATLLLQAATIAHAQSQVKTSPDSRSVVIGDTRVTIFQVGVVAGNMKTGKVIWRDGFAADSVRNDYIVDSLIAIKNYVFFRKISRGSMSPDYGVLLNAKDGRFQEVRVQHFLLFEDDNLYFDSTDPFEIIYKQGGTFGTIVITKFHAISKQKRIIIFDPDDYIKDARKCILISESGRTWLFQFNSKTQSTWNFVFKNTRCQIDVGFDEYDLEKYTINITRL